MIYTYYHEDLLKLYHETVLYKRSFRRMSLKTQQNIAQIKKITGS